MLDVASLPWLWVFEDGRITEDDRSGKSPLWELVRSPSILAISTADWDAVIRAVWSAEFGALNLTEPFIDGAMPSLSGGKFIEAARAILQDRPVSNLKVVL